MNTRIAPPLSYLLSIAGFFGLPACDSGDADHPPRSNEQSALIAASPTADWRQSVAHTVSQLRRQQPQLATDLYRLSPRRTRAGTLRFTGPIVRQPAAAAVFLDRLQARHDNAPTREALAEALPATTGAFGSALVALLEDEPNPRVRAAMVAALRTADSVSALSGLELGLRDPNDEVRAWAARTAARRRDGNALIGPLLRVASTSNTGSELEVKLAAIRSLGALGATDATQLLQSELASTQPQLRLASIRALQQVAPELAATHAARMVSDANPKVANAASKILMPPSRVLRP